VLSGVTASTYGSATVVPVLTVNAAGQVTAVSSATIAASGGGLALQPSTATITISSGLVINATLFTVAGATQVVISSDSQSQGVVFNLGASTMTVNQVGIGTTTPQAKLEVNGFVQFDSSATISTTLAVSTITMTGVTFANIGSAAANGTLRYCSDCTTTTPSTCTANLLSSCVCAGSGSGAFAKRLNGAWYCQ
jgi:hypothetical protein